VTAPSHNDVPDELAEKVLRIFPDFGIEGDAYLWDLNGVCIGVEGVGGSEEFAKRFEKWAYRWDECMNIKTLELDAAKLAAERFDEQGLALAGELKRLVGEKSKVVYDFILKKGTVEVLADGSTRDWPPGINFDANRKRVLDEEIARKLA
jgi:hypothetical protein